jgi:hypothetical protein
MLGSAGRRFVFFRNRNRRLVHGFFRLGMKPLPGRGNGGIPGCDCRLNDGERRSVEFNEI